MRAVTSNPRLLTKQAQSWLAWASLIGAATDWLQTIAGQP